MQNMYDKVQHLLRLANDTNSPAEAANAAAQAQSIIEKYRLDTAKLSDSEKVEEDIRAEVQPLRRGKQRMITWMMYLSVAVAEANNCAIYLSGPNIMIVGRESDSKIVRYLFTYLVRECERLCTIAKKENKGKGKTWTNSYKLGFVREVKRRLIEARRLTRQNVETAAIVKVDNQLAEVKSWVAEHMNLRKSKQSQSVSVNQGAFAAGKRDGGTVALNKGLQGSGSTKMLS